MKKVLSISCALASLASIAVVSVSAPAFAEKKCKYGYVWDADKKKCVKEKRGSY